MSSQMPSQQHIERQPELTPQTYQALLWIAHSPRTAADLATLQHITKQGANRRITHLKRLNLVQDDNPETGTFTVTRHARGLLNDSAS